MKVKVVPLTSFVHGNIDAHEGKEFNCEKGLADEFERAGLVRIKRTSVTTATTAAGSEPGKATGDGVGQPSSASPAAPASPTTTPPPSGTGSRRPRRAGT